MIGLIFKFFRRESLIEDAVIGLDNLGSNHLIWSVMYGANQT